MQRVTRLPLILSLLAVFTAYAANLDLLSGDASAQLGDGTIAYEQPTNIVPAKISMQVVIGFVVALAALAIFVMFKKRR